MNKPMDTFLAGSWTRNRLTHKSFRPYAIAVGQAALAWNQLQESLGELFSSVVRIEAADDLGIIRTIWNSMESDRAQRKMIRAALNRLANHEEISIEAHMQIKWLLDEADKLSDDRNDAIHSPLESLTGSVTLAPVIGRPSVSTTHVRPQSRSGHPRAKKLAGKNLLDEFRRCRDTALVLSKHCTVVRWGLHREKNGKPQAWSKTPRLPNRGQKSRSPPQGR